MHKIRKSLKIMKFSLAIFILHAYNTEYKVTAMQKSRRFSKNRLIIIHADE